MPKDANTAFHAWFHNRHNPSEEAPAKIEASAQTFIEIMGFSPEALEEARDRLAQEIELGLVL